MAQVKVDNPSPFKIRHRGKMIAKRTLGQVFEVARPKQFVKELMAMGNPSLKAYVVEEVEETDSEESAGTDSEGVTTVSFDDLGLSGQLAGKLVDADLGTIEALTQATEQDIMDVNGIADAGLADVVEALAKFDLTLKEEA